MGWDDVSSPLALAIGVLGGIYPAWRVTRMTPLKVLGAT